MTRIRPCQWNSIVVIVFIPTTLTGCGQTADMRIRPIDRQISVGGKGWATGAPDVFRIKVGAITLDKNFDAARRMVGEISNRVLNVARRFPLDSKRSATSAFFVEPKYANAWARTDEFLGYQCAQEFQFTLTDLSKAEEFTTELVRAGATSIDARFEITQRAALDDQARSNALADATHRAKTMAANLGVGVGRVLSIRDDDWSSYGGALFEDSSDSDDSVELRFLTPTQLAIESEVTVHFELIDVPRE